MADFTALKTAIQNAIKQNGNEEITGNILQEVLLAIVTTLGDGSINDLITALDSEATTRQQADGTLQQNIDAEATARSNADTALGGRIDDEATARSNADTALGGRIDDEATARGNADTALANRLGSTITAENTAAAQIGAEAEARAAADTALQELIEGITDNIENGYVYAGIATPSSTPATGKVFYLALTAGTYTNFGSTVVSQGINILKYNGSAWSLDTFVGIDDTPIPNSPKLVKSGGAFESVMANSSAFDISAHFASGGTLATYADLSAALNALDTLSASYKRGGMSIKFVQSSENNYVQYRLIVNQWSTNESDWQGVDKEPISRSKNLVESGGVEHLFSLLGDAENLFTDKDIIWLDGYINNVGDVVQHSSWKYAIIDVSNFNPGYYTLWRDSDSRWDASLSSYHKIFKYSSVDTIDNSTFLGGETTSSFEITEQVKGIIISTDDSYEKTLSSVRLSFGEDADYNEGVFTIFKKNIPYLSSYINRQELDTLFGQNQDGVSYPFIKSYTHANPVDFSVTPNRYINVPTGVVIGGGNDWKLYAWWAAEEETTYTVYEDSENTFNDSSYHYVGCFSSKNTDSFLGIALDKGNGVHVTLEGTKYIALSAKNSNYTKENVKLIKGANKAYNTVQKNVLDYNVEHGLGVDSNSIVGDLTPKQQGKYRHFDLSTSGVIMFIGNSYTAGGFSLKKKQYEYLVGILTNFIPVNYGQGAVSITARYNSFLNDLNDGQSSGFPKPSQLNIKYAVLAEARNFSGSATEYKVALVKFIELLKGRGIVPILSTEHYGLNSDVNESERIQMMQEVADTYNIPFLKWGDFAQAMQVQGFPGFLYGTHVATRTYWTWANGIIPYINTLDYVDGIKLFRKRPTESFLELPTFNNIFERGKYFEEFTMSGAGNTPATEKYVDRQNQGVAENIGNEYGTLMTKTGSVTAGNYLLIQITTENNINELTINIDADNVTSAYFKRNDGSWTSINYSSTIELSQYIKYFGECPYLLLVGENISVRNVSVDYLGVDRRKNQRHLQKGIYGESIVYPFIDNEHWNGTFTYYTPIVDGNGNVEPLPNGINNVAELKTNESSLTQSFIFSNERYNADKCQLKILARYFPKYIKTDADWENTEITTETFDMAKLSITIGNINIERYVGMWWNEILVDVYLPGNSSILIESPDGKNVQVAKVELIKYT